MRKRPGRQIRNLKRRIAFFSRQALRFFHGPKPFTRCDVCMVTNLSFPGGNASSILEDAATLMEAGLSVKLVHCPPDGETYRPLSVRYDRYKSICHDARDIKAGIACDLLIVRHPKAICSASFKNFAARVSADAAFFIINNSRYLEDGTPVYEPDRLKEHIDSVKSPIKILFPVGPGIREELAEESVAACLSALDWTPVFSPKAFPYNERHWDASRSVIGRHARDLPEEWPSDKHKLLQVYPERNDIHVHILGGADTAIRTIGHKPANWTIMAFGSMHPAEFLKDLDVFVYFPHENLRDAFPRNVVEAIFCGLPCILPPSFRQSFGSLAIYCQPDDIMSAVVRLKESGTWRRSFTRYACELAMQKYGPHALTTRLARNASFLADRLNPEGLSNIESPTAINSEQFAAYALWVASGEGVVDYCGEQPQ